MKKILFLLVMFAAFVACSKDDDEKDSTFRIINNREKYESTYDKYLNGSLYEVIVFEYDENGDNVGQINVDDISADGGMSEKIQVSSTCVKIQISFKLLPEQSPNYDLSSNARKYVSSLGVIKKGENTDIVIDDNTIVKNSSSVKSKSMSEENYMIDFVNTLISDIN